jgi:heavy metal sensor kinase
MTLVNRVSAYFLAALAVVLASCSALFYGVVQRQLTRQFEQELLSAHQALAAAVEIETDEVKWQAAEHAAGSTPGEVRWVVVADGDRIVETSHNVSPEFVAEARSLAGKAPPFPAVARVPALPEWRILRQRLVAPSPDRTERELDEFDEIAIVVGRPAAGLNASLARLAAFAVFVPLAGWLAAAAVGRWLCKRALQPVFDMSREAAAISGADFQRRLTVAASGDELAELAVAFNGLLERLQSVFDAQRRFAGDAAHELRTPLTVLLGQIDVARRKPRTAEEYRDTLALLHDEAGELRQIVESLLYLARADAESNPPALSPVELSLWLAERIERLRNNPRYGDVQLRVEQPAEVAASLPLLNRLLDNLLSNALKYSAAGTPVTVALTRDNGEAIVSVADQGRGIDSRDVPSIFDPFFRAAAARSAGVGGVGLGLAIADRIARVFGGRLECQSEPGRGSTFSLRLPLLDRTAPPP